MGHFTALFDACVLYPAPLRDFLMHLALTDLFRAKWTNEIQVRDCLVFGYADLIPSLTLPDQNDRHILAAAICGGADTIVTYNLSDFPVETLGQYGIEAQHPDEFITHLIESIIPPSG